MSLQEFTTACFECAEWADCGPDHETHECEWSNETRLDLEADCRSFWRRFGCFIETRESDNEWSIAARAGHDFWLTRNGHGAGFWDRGDLWGPYEEMLVNGSKSYGEFQLYRGDDGLIYA